LELLRTIDVTRYIDEVELFSSGDMRVTEIQSKIYYTLMKE